MLLSFTLNYRHPFNLHDIISLTFPKNFILDGLLIDTSRARLDPFPPAVFLKADLISNRLLG